MTDCARCQILEEENRQLRAELDRRDTLPSPAAYLHECERVHRRTTEFDELLPTEAQEGP